MQGNSVRLSKKYVVIPFVALYVAAMMVFTLYDLPIAEWIYHPRNTFGKIFEVFGIIPTIVFGIWGGEAVILTANDKTKMRSWVLGVLAAVFFAGFGILAIVNLNKPFVWLIVGVSRMTLGAHFATDIVSGFALTFGAILIIDYIFYRKDKAAASKVSTLIE